MGFDDAMKRGQNDADQAASEAFQRSELDARLRARAQEELDRIAGLALRALDGAGVPVQRFWRYTSGFWGSKDKPDAGRGWVIHPKLYYLSDGGTTQTGLALTEGRAWHTVDLHSGERWWLGRSFKGADFSRWGGGRFLSEISSVWMSMSDSGQLLLDLREGRLDTVDFEDWVGERLGTILANRR